MDNIQPLTEVFDRFAQEIDDLITGNLGAAGQARGGFRQVLPQILDLAA